VPSGGLAVKHMVVMIFPPIRSGQVQSPIHAAIWPCSKIMKLLHQCHSGFGWPVEWPGPAHLANRSPWGWRPRTHLATLPVKCCTRWSRRAWSMCEHLRRDLSRKAQLPHRKTRKISPRRTLSDRWSADFRTTGSVTFCVKGQLF